MNFNIIMIILIKIFISDHIKHVDKQNESGSNQEKNSGRHLSGKEAYSAAVQELYGRLDEWYKTVKQGEEDLTSWLCGVHRVEPPVKKRKVDFESSENIVIPESLDKSTLLHTCRMIHLLPVHEANDLKFTTNDSSDHVAAVYVWKNDNYFTRNTIGEIGETKEVFGAFITKDQLLNSSSDMLIFWRSEMTRIVEFFNEELTDNCGDSDDESERSDNESESEEQDDAIEEKEQGNTENSVEIKPICLIGPPGTGKSKLAFIYAMTLAKKGKSVLWINCKSICHPQFSDLLLVTNGGFVQLAVGVSESLVKKVLETVGPEDFVFIDGIKRATPELFLKGIKCRTIYIALHEVGTRKFLDNMKGTVMLGWQKNEYAKAFEDKDIRKRLIDSFSDEDEEAFKTNYLFVLFRPEAIRFTDLKEKGKQLNLCTEYVNASEMYSNNKLLKELMTDIEEGDYEKAVKEELQKAAIHGAAVQRNLKMMTKPEKTTLKRKIFRCITKSSYWDFLQTLKEDNIIQDCDRDGDKTFTLLLFSIGMKNDSLNKYKNHKSLEEKVRQHMKERGIKRKNWMEVIPNMAKSPKWNFSEGLKKAIATSSPKQKRILMEFFLNGAELFLNSVNSEKLINH